MGRQALITLDHVKTAVAALRTDGKPVSSRGVRERLGNVGSMGTINKLLQQCLGEKDVGPQSLRQLPPELQYAILTFVDQQADYARKEIAEELVRYKQETLDLANDNERLSTTLGDQREQLAQAAADRASAEGRVMQLMDELASAREATRAERLATEATRVELVKLQLRVEVIVPVEAELREAREQCQSQRDACARAEQAAAVLEAQKLALESQVQELKSALTTARATNERFEKRVGDLSGLLDREREARAIAERDLAVAFVTFNGRTRSGKKAQKEACGTGNSVVG